MEDIDTCTGKEPQKSIMIQKAKSSIGGEIPGCCSVCFIDIDFYLCKNNALFMGEVLSEDIIRKIIVGTKQMQLL